MSPIRFKTIEIPVSIPIMKSRIELSIIRNLSARIAIARHKLPTGISHSSRNNTTKSPVKHPAQL